MNRAAIPAFAAAGDDDGLFAAGGEDVARSAPRRPHPFPLREGGPSGYELVDVQKMADGAGK